MSDIPRTLSGMLESGAVIHLQADDLVFSFVPLMRHIAALHAHGKVARLTLDQIVEHADGRLILAQPDGTEPAYNSAGLRRIQPHANSALSIVGEYRVTTDQVSGSVVENMQVLEDAPDHMEQPLYLTRYRAWEHEIQHHDELTDIFVTGLVLASFACGLNFNESEPLKRFANCRTNLFRLAPRLNPVIATLISEMTTLDRHARATDMSMLADRLENYRDQPATLDIERALDGETGAPARRAAVLKHLRDRLFDLSRRNKLIHFRTSQASVNMTIASVPIVMRLEAVRADQLCTWQGSFAEQIISSRPMPLGKWLRFEDQPYLPSSLDKIIQEARRDKAEYGFSNVRLVIAFLHWNNLKDAPGERIVSPLLWLPVELTKKKGVRDQYTLQASSTDAEINPALRHYLDQLYDIKLPETIDLESTAVEQLHADIARQINRTEPNVKLALETKPEIRLIHEKAMQRMRQFQRRQAQKTDNASAIRPDFNYDRNDYRPLGRTLFTRYVELSPLPQRLAAGGHVAARSDQMAASAGTQTAYSIGRDSGHRYDWLVDLTQVTLANFNYKKMSLVRDYSQLIETTGGLPAFDRVFSVEPREISDEKPSPLPPVQQWDVVPADSTQRSAVAYARTGRSFIIQGPPGTGKSQTITNLIADYAARGKRVLFVCEKRAALDVVFHRLKQAKLDPLCCIIHDAVEDKKEFVRDLKQSYETWVKTAPDLARFQQLRAEILDAHGRHLKKLSDFQSAMQAAPDDVGVALRSLIHRREALADSADALTPAGKMRLPTVGDWDAHQSVTDRIARWLSGQAHKNSFGGHPLCHLGAGPITDADPYGRAERAITQALDLLDDISDLISKCSPVLADGQTVAHALHMATLAQQLVETNLASHLLCLDENTVQSTALDSQRAKIEVAKVAAAAARQDVTHWKKRLSPDDARAALVQAHQLETAFFRFLSGKWRNLKKTLNQHYDFSAHAVRPTFVRVLENLVAAQQAEAAVASHGLELENDLGTKNLDGFLDCRAQVQADRVTLAHLRQCIEKLPDPVQQKQALAHAGRTAALLSEIAESVSSQFHGLDHLTLAAFGEKLRDMREVLDELPDLHGPLKALHQAGGAYANALLTLPMTVPQLERAVLTEGMDRILRQVPELRHVTAHDLLQASRKVSRARQMLTEANAAALCAARHHSLIQKIKQSQVAISQLDADGREFKKNYGTGRRELEHEFGKTMRFRSIRDLSGDETGMIVNDLKPVWLMSPLSVSDALPLEPALFDVVIFDEASQIPMEDSVPALCRAAQVIIVGDENQLPPTSFFSSALGDEDMRIDAEDEDGKMSILMDADSLLIQAARNLDGTMLAWHYRSRSESLISFSNAAFYRGELITIPDRRIAQPPADTGVAADIEKTGASAADETLARPISFHLLDTAVYTSRTNPAEARYIADMVRALLGGKSDKSIGIVAFSEAQQSEIEAALDRLAEKDSPFAALLEKAFVREDDNQFNGLFIKNLENVQGDERDIIILSICYGPDSSGRMAMNFGPINQRGGEKRLNVIFSRSRHHMAVVTSIRGNKITNTHNDGARALQAFLNFADAQSQGAADHAQAVLGSLNPEAGEIFGMAAQRDVVRQSIADALRLRGHDVAENVGCARFRCDLAIAEPDGTSHRLAVLLDRDMQVTPADVEDHHVFRPGILQVFGWRVLNVSALDWAQDEDAVLARIEACLERDIAEDIDDNPLEGQRSAAAPSPAAAPAPGPVSAAISDVAFTSYHFRDGSSDKFWRIGVHATEVTVQFGRVGTTGQTVVKNYESAERARREADKLVLEKTRKGYTETDMTA